MGRSRSRPVTRSISPRPPRTAGGPATKPSRPSTSTPRRRSSQAVMYRDLRLDALLSIPALFAPRVSPDGKWVAWSWSRLGPAADAFAAPTDGSQPPLQLTETVEGDTAVVSWTPDSEAVLVSEDRDGDERVRLFRIDLAEPEVREPLTAAQPNYYLRGGQLHRDGRWLV